MFKQTKKVCFYCNWQVEIDYKAIGVYKRPDVSWMDETTVLIFIAIQFLVSELTYWQGVKKKGGGVNCEKSPIQTIWSVQIYTKYPTLISLWGHDH